mmetsp:Transcript_40185/g.84417  ORF Transcript_40185/g.84417 Transcript_40185/m.84417 type:complete len:214 (-) Transcript_40185:258-899(-)
MGITPIPEEIGIRPEPINASGPIEFGRQLFSMLIPLEPWRESEDSDSDDAKESLIMVFSVGAGELQPDRTSFPSLLPSLDGVLLGRFTGFFFFGAEVLPVLTMSFSSTKSLSIFETAVTNSIVSGSIALQLLATIRAISVKDATPWLFRCDRFLSLPFEDRNHKRGMSRSWYREGRGGSWSAANFFASSLADASSSFFMTAPLSRRRRCRSRR